MCDMLFVQSKQMSEVTNGMIPPIIEEWREYQAPQGFDPSIFNMDADSTRNSNLEMIYYGHEQCVPGKVWGPGVKGLHKVHYVHSGRGTIITQGTTHIVSQGQCFVFYPDAKIFYEADPKDPWCYSWIAFAGTNAEYYFERAGVDRAGIVIAQFDRALMEEEFGKLMRLSPEDPAKDIKLLGHLHMILACIARYAASHGGSEASTHASSYVKTAVQYIRSNYGENVSVDKLAKLLSLDRKYFSRIFKEVMKVSPNAFIANYRISKAKELLQRPDLSINEISISLGYGNQFSFSRAFKSNTNVSPTEYRKSLGIQLDETD